MFFLLHKFLNCEYFSFVTIAVGPDVSFRLSMAISTEENSALRGLVAKAGRNNPLILLYLHNNPVE